MKLEANPLPDEPRVVGKVGNIRGVSINADGTISIEAEIELDEGSDLPSLEEVEDEFL